MIYARTTDGGILIGLSEGNVSKLKQGQPILKQQQSGLPTLRVIYGETEEAILQMLVDEGVLSPDLLKGRT